MLVITNWLEWLENTSWSITIRESVWLYPALEIVHITGIALLVGAAFMFDLRLLGFSKNLPVKGLANHLLSWSARGLIVVIPSGMLLFITNAEALANDPIFWTKMTLLLIAGMNAAVFHRFALRSSSGWNERTTPPLNAKVAAILSIIVWLSVITCGRLLAY